METVSYLIQGFAQLLNPWMLFLCFLGSIMGTLIGVLPGLGPSAAIAMLLPVTYIMEPLEALVMLSGMFYGAAYGGSTTSILINVPGEGSSVPTTFDGYPLARQGKAGIALGIAAIGSFIAGTAGTIILTFLAVPLARWGLKFGPPEFFTVLLFAFIAVVGLNEKGLIKAFFALFIGLLLATVGFDVQTGIGRHTFGSMALLDGVPFLSAAVGLFGLSEIVHEMVHPSEIIDEGGDIRITLKSMFPSWKEFKQTFPTMVRSCLLGFVVGVLPGAGANVASFMAYDVEKRCSKTPEKFGTGMLEGVAAPETANNASCSGSFVPLLALGIPGSGTTAVILGAFIMMGLQPGPELFSKHPDVVWGLIASMYIGNVMLLILNTAFIPFFVWLLKISRNCISVVVATLCFIGVYGLNYSMKDIWLMLFFTVIGYLFKENKIPPAPLILSLLLGAKAENSFRQALIMSKGSPMIFFTRPICIFMFALCASFLLVPQLSRIRKLVRSKAA